MSTENNNKQYFTDGTQSWKNKVDGATLLDDIYNVIIQHIACSHETAIATTLWIVFTWFIDDAYISPIAIITAPEKRCGKSTLLSLIHKLTNNPLIASNITSSVVFRVIEKFKPTLLIDEADSFIKDNEELRGIINSGHTRDNAYVFRSVGNNHEPKRFSTWGAKAISGIGYLPDTLMDRGIILELRRKLPSEKVERLRHADLQKFNDLKSKIKKFSEDNKDLFIKSRPSLPAQLNDRMQDNWEHLIAIADLTRSKWGQLARSTAIKISFKHKDDQSISIELLKDIKLIFSQEKLQKISSERLIYSLCKDHTKPWSTYNKGNKITPRQLSSLLKKYGIESKNIKLKNNKVPKGYELKQFKDTFNRYLPQGKSIKSATPLPDAKKPLIQDYSDLLGQKNSNATSTPIQPEKHLNIN